MLEGSLSVLSIYENELVDLGEHEIEILRNELVKNPDLPLRISKKTIIFNNYTVGTLQIGNLLIEIKPRNSIFTLSKIFEMIIYENSSSLNPHIQTSGYSENNQFGFDSISNSFLSTCNKLVDFGVTGDFVTESFHTNIISGEIIIEEFSNKIIPVRGIKINAEKYNVDILPNQIIKSALKKLLRYEQRFVLRREIFHILKYFSGVSDIVFYNKSKIIGAEEYYSANTYYPTVLEIAIQILFDMKITYSGGKISFYSFLYNSNEIFERYVRKVVSDGLEYKVTKWSEPRPIASITNKGSNVIKTFSPDIIISYDEDSNTAMAVLDVKNKSFMPDSTKTSDLLESSDLYQLLVYCDKLNSKLGAIIYPCNCYHDEIVVNAIGNRDHRFVLLSINMEDSLKNRHNKLINDLKKNLLSYY